MCDIWPTHMYTHTGGTNVRPLTSSELHIPVQMHSCPETRLCCTISQNPLYFFLVLLLTRFWLAWFQFECCLLRQRCKEEENKEIVYRDYNNQKSNNALDVFSLSHTVQERWGFAHSGEVEVKGMWTGQGEGACSLWQQYTDHNNRHTSSCLNNSWALLNSFAVSSHCGWHCLSHF